MVAPMRPPPPTDPVAVSRLLGANRAAPGPAAPVASLSSRFSLLGVVSAASHDGAALIAVDGKPARPYHVGAPIDESLVLQSVQPRQAVLANSLGGPPVLTLELPPFKR